MVCFLVLMQNGKGVLDKSPLYIGEKVAMINEEWNAFAYLDIHNMRKVMEWLVAWKFEPPVEVAERFKAECEAWEELKEKGIEI